MPGRRLFAELDRERHNRMDERFGVGGNYCAGSEKGVLDPQPLDLLAVLEVLGQQAVSASR